MRLPYPSRRASICKNIPIMDDADILRLNVERFRRMLQTETDETMRQSVQKILEEFEVKLASARTRAKSVQASRSPSQDDQQPKT